ncbi:MAG: Asp-tRNA(Asn)/Glu-tRNA(Gln) amidotransferase subunit GatA [Planctomycetota bacterium]|nr:Asp-tRNA(Asn)/Glu-tRNA(Gln) amidotransferase subunit GatA [Planctomycetota bacterium]
MSLTDATAAQLQILLHKREVTSEEVTRAYLDRIGALDTQVQAFLVVNADQAMETARNVDRKRLSGEPLGKLAGIPVAVKDVLCVRAEPTTCGSRMLEHYRPPYDAFVVDRLKESDAVIIGKVNMDEFAMGSSTEHSAFQITRNPWDMSCIPGGSSGGSAAAVASRMAPLSVGTDTGGSIRQPASLCGVTGLKPTYGRVSRFGLVAFASSLDQVGPLSTDVTDTALLLEVLAGYDPRDSTSVDIPVPEYVQQLKRSEKPLRLGLVREHFDDGLDPEVDRAIRSAVKVFQNEGAEISEISLPHSKYAVATYYLVAPCEAASNLARYDGVHFGHRAKTYEDLTDMCRSTRATGFGPEVKRRIMLGTYALSAGYYEAYYLKALKVRRLIRQDFDLAFQNVDLLIGPTYPRVAFPLSQHFEDPLSMYLADIYTTSANLAGIPAISVPCGFSDSGLPIGLQIQAPAFQESPLLQAAWLFQQCTDWHREQPSLEDNTTELL